MGRQNYKGPGWNRAALVGEARRRGIVGGSALSDDQFRQMLIAYDEKRLPGEGDRGPWIMTVTGKRFYPLAPRPEEFDRRDIAHSLALTCRFNGHLNRFYSVAQHSMILRKLLPDSLAAWALLHDAAEAYLGDLVRPIKQSWQVFTDAENHLLEVMARAFHLSWPMPEELKKMDFLLGLAEARAFGMDISDWSIPDGWFPQDVALPLPDIMPFLSSNELCNWSWRAVESVFLRQLSQV